MSELLIGCGNDRRKKVSFADSPTEWTELTTLDVDPSCHPDVRHDLNKLPYPFLPNTFDEIHAYEVLEHCGRQGDYRFFFAQFDEFWRILKPGGYFIGSAPMWDSMWAWGDPGHTRIITKGSLVFLNQKEYEQVGTTAMTDYRRIYKGNFETCGIVEENDNFGFVLRAIKDAAPHK
jgi:SAM-dependent methyltransferase